MWTIHEGKAEQPAQLTNIISYSCETIAYAIRSRVS